jgi:hypothetical protein
MSLENYITSRDLNRGQYSPQGGQMIDKNGDVLDFTEVVKDLVDGKIGIQTNTGEWLPSLGIDTTDDDYYYFGFTKVGDDGAWRIKRMSKTNYATDWASGDEDPDDAWTDRATQTYSSTI